MQARPVNPIIRLGQSILPSLELRTCGGRKRWHPEVVWRAADPRIAAVDTLTDRVTGISVGQTYVTPFERRDNGEVVEYSSVYLTVIP